MKTVIGIVLDESSSMFDRKDQVINGFNKFVEDQKKITDDSARLFLVKFSSRVKVVHSGNPLEEIPPLTNGDYMPNGSTALYDAFAQCVQIMDEEKTPEERAICVIMTDGEENCSQKTSISDIQRIIRTHEQQNDWTFLYIGVEVEEWVRRSGMTPLFCSPGFSEPPPAYHTNIPFPRRNNNYGFQPRPRFRSNWHPIGLNGVPSPLNNNTSPWNTMRQYVTPVSNGSDEMVQLTTAVSSIRRSRTRCYRDTGSPFQNGTK